MTQGLICRGDLEGAWCVAESSALLDNAKRLYFLPEADSTDLNARKMPPQFPEWARHRLQIPSRKKRLRIADAINGMSSWKGGDLFVSEGAARQLETYVRDDCRFVPALIDGVNEPYFLVWITTLVDALDYQASDAVDAPWSDSAGTKPKRIRRFAFKGTKIEGRLLFRLPGKGLTEDSLHNFCTLEFVRLIEKLKISGFGFAHGGQDAPYVPVP